MLLFHFDTLGNRSIADLDGLFHGCSIFIIGGAPTVDPTQRLMLSGRNVLAMALNNAAIQGATSFWCGADHPDCYHPRVLTNPTTMKFAPLPHAEANFADRPYFDLPNTFFYVPEANRPWGQFFDPGPNVPWFHNTLFVSLHIAYMLGFRRIYLVGCDFEFQGGEVYAHRTNLTVEELDWNRRLYAYQAEELVGLKSIFTKAGLTLIDTSTKSKLNDTYQWMNLQDAIQRETNVTDSVVDTTALPHSSRFARTTIDAIVESRLTPGVRSERSQKAVTVI